MKKTYLTPHTSEWFLMMFEFDPMKALQSRTICEAANSSEVCSICGDFPAMDYEVVDAQFAPNMPVTIRLCDDCVKIQTIGGAHFMALPPKVVN